ncbi:molybdenum cofactor biosynthesis protein [Rhodothermaceae bacterium RA]|nr:molybdenum cofactor biosynthesis protein [Rhodothermaceae bacterium RA]
MSHEEHKLRARFLPVRCAILTISDTRNETTDRSGGIIRARLQRAGHELVTYRIVPDEPLIIRAAMKELSGKVEAVLSNGGTGISKRDSTYEVLSELIQKPLPGYGELFRMLSYEEIGASAMLSRALAGVYDDTLYFAMPGSTNAVKLAMDKLILPELKHLVWELIRQAKIEEEDAEGAENG